MEGHAVDNNASHCGYVYALRDWIVFIPPIALEFTRYSELTKPTKATRKAWVEAYNLVRDEARSAPTPALGRMLIRIETPVIKTALLFAMLSGHSQIEVDDLSRSLELGDYCGKTAAEVAGMGMGTTTRG